MWFHRESSLFLFFYFLFSLLTTVSIYIEVNLSLKRVNNVNSESKENWNISIQRSLRMVHGSRVEDIKIVERIKVSLYVTIRDTFHVLVYMCEPERTCCDTCTYFIAVETFGFDALVSNIVNIVIKKKKGEEEISKEKYVCIFSIFFPNMF